jgi:hypothetical protein
MNGVNEWGQSLEVSEWGQSLEVSIFLLRIVEASRCDACNFFCGKPPTIEIVGLGGESSRCGVIRVRSSKQVFFSNK